MVIDESILKAAVDKWGVNAQVKMMREECLELAVEISKFYDRDGSDARFAKVIAEMADVTIMAKQMELIPDFAEKIQERVNFKMARLEKRLNNNEF